MRSIIFVVALVALFAIGTGAPLDEDVIQHIPQKTNPTPSGTPDAASESGAAEDASDAGEAHVAEVRVRRDVGGQESDLLPSGNDIEASPFGEVSQVAGRGRIKVLPAFLG